MKWSFLALLVFQVLSLCAEGTRELAPNPSILVKGVQTTDVTAIYIGASSYGNFANHNGELPSTRLNVRILDPASECLYIGFSSADEPFNGLGQVMYVAHVFDPAGNLIFSSDTISDSSTTQIKNWREAFNGPVQLVGNQGYNALHISSTALQSAGWTGEGDYFVKFQRIDNPSQPYYIPFWDITVADCSRSEHAERVGRVWSYQWALFTPPATSAGSNFDRPFNGTFYIVDPDDVDTTSAFITKMDFNNSQFRGAAFSVALNSFGARRDGTIEENRRSVYNRNSIIEEYPVFLNDPVDLYKTANVNGLEILGSSGCMPHNFCFRARPFVNGVIEMLVDLHGSNNEYDENSKDVIIHVEVDVAEIGQEICVPWDGVDGLGNYIGDENLDSISIRTFLRQGIYHFPIYDVEHIGVGFKIETVRPVGIAPLLYYDDRDIPESNGTNSPLINLNGCETPCHTWRLKETNPNAGFGNENTINSWWYARTLIDINKVAIRPGKEINLFAKFCSGGQVEIRDTIFKNPGVFSWKYQTWFGCDSIIRLHIDEILPDAIIAESAQILNCYDPIIELNGGLSPPFKDLIFEWSRTDGIPIDSANSQTITVDRPGTYILSIHDKDVGCPDKTSVEILEDFSLPEIDLVHVPTLKCRNIGKKILVSPMETEDKYDIEWTTNTGEFESDRNVFSPTILSPGKYYFSITDIESGCVVFDSVDVIRDSLSYLEIMIDDILEFDFCERVSIDTEISSTAYESIVWTPSDRLSCSDCLSPQLLTDHAPLLTITVTDTNGCIKKQNVLIELERDFKLFIPSAFSPNNDGINDVLKIFSSTCPVEIVAFTIFDRWGNKVFERQNFISTEMDVGWGGYIRNSNFSPETYAYVLQVRTYNDNLITQSGNIHLIR